MFRSLTHYWRVNLAVLAGSAVTTAVLTGALLVGDSVRGSLKDLTEDRLGRTDLAVVSERWFRAELADAVVDTSSDAPDAMAPMLLLHGTALHATGATGGARANGVNVAGIDARFGSLYPSYTPSPSSHTAIALDRRPGQALPSIVLNESLRAELDAKVGDEILVSLPRPGEAPAGSILGRRDLEKVVATMRCEIVAVIADRGPGRFGLSARQALPLNAYVRLDELQRAMGAGQKINTILLAREAAFRPELEKDLKGAIGLPDAGLLVSTDTRHVTVSSSDFVLAPSQVAAIGQAAAAAGGRTQEISTYLANELRLGGHSLSYSTITAIDPKGEPFEWLQLVGGGAAPPLATDEILLDAWAAEDLAAAPADELDLTWYVIGDREQIHERTTRFRVKGIVAMTGLAIDPTLTPDYPGIKSARHIASWDPPFPVDFKRIRPRDEDYWDKYGPTPKAFVSRAAGEALWSSRYGSVTAVRIAPPAAEPVREFAQRFGHELRARTPLAATGIQIRDLKAEGGEASGGATDFGMLFVSFSSFLIVSSTLLSGLLFRLGVEQRAREIGVLLAVGYPVKRVQRRFLGEGILVAAAGVIPGLAGGAAYAGLLMVGLRTVWRSAVGTSQLYLHVTWQSLLLGGAISVGIVALSILVSVRRLERHPVPALIAGRFGSRAATRPGRWPRRLAIGALVAGAALLAYALEAGESSSPALAFGVGACLLVSGLAFFSVWCGGATRRPALLPGRALLARMAARNSSWNPGRSLLSVALIGSACFVILTVAAAGRSADSDASRDDRIGSAQGGYRLMAESDIPLHQDLNTPQGREALGMAPEAAGLFDGVVVMPFRTVPGDDTSCANLYRPGRPRLIGVPQEQIQRGGFHFKSAIGDSASPWRLLDEPVGSDGSAQSEVVPAIGDENSVLWILHKGLGQDLMIENERGEPVRLRFVALLEGSLFQSEILISEKSLERHFGSRDGYSFFLIAAPAQRSADLTRMLETSLGRQGFDVTSVAERLAGYRAVEQTYLATFEVLGGLGLLLGTVGLSVVVFRNVHERRAELAAMRAFGYARSALASVVLVEVFFLLCVGVAVGAVPAMAAVAPRLAGAGSGAIPWGSLMITVAAVLGVGMLSSVAALAGALRAPLLPTLKQEC